MKNSVTLLKSTISSNKAQKTRQRNKEQRAALSHRRAFLRVLSPLKKLARKWDKIFSVKKQFRPLFKEYGLYRQGYSLLEIFIQKEQSDTFGVFLTWKITSAKIGLTIFEISRGEETIIGDIAEATYFTEEMLKTLKKIVSISEKDLIRQIVKRYSAEEHTPQSLLSKKSFDMTNEGYSSSSNDWEKACLELSHDGYFNGDENLYEILVKAEEELLVDKQKVTVLGTKLLYLRDKGDKDEVVPERCLIEKTVTMGYLRRIFFLSKKTPFTLEWYKNHSEWRMACAMMSKNRGPVIIGQSE